MPKGIRLFGRKIAKRRNAEHMTQPQLASALGVSLETIKRWEAHERVNAAKDVLPKLAAAFKMDPAAAEAEFYAGAADAPTVRTMRIDLTPEAHQELMQMIGTTQSVSQWVESAIWHLRGAGRSEQPVRALLVRDMPEEGERVGPLSTVVSKTVDDLLAKLLGSGQGQKIRMEIDALKQMLADEVHYRVAAELAASKLKHESARLLSRRRLGVGPVPTHEAAMREPKREGK